MDKVCALCNNKFLIPPIQQPKNEKLNNYSANNQPEQNNNQRSYQLAPTKQGN